MSREGGDNHFISARGQDLRALLEEGCAELELNAAQAEMLEAFLETAWLAGTRSGHAKLLNHAIREREAHGEGDGDGEWEAHVEPVQPEEVEAEFKATMEAAADSMNLSIGRTVALWDLLSRAWTSGANTYESEVMASLIERRSGSVAEQAERWLEDGREAGGTG